MLTSYFNVKFNPFIDLRSLSSGLVVTAVCTGSAHQMLRLMQDGKVWLPLNMVLNLETWFLFNFCNIYVWMDLFVQCAAKITAMDGLSFQGLIFLMFFVLLNSEITLSFFFCFWNCRFKMVEKKKQYQLQTVWYWWFAHCVNILISFWQYEQMYFYSNGLCGHELTWTKTTTKKKKISFVKWHCTLS